MSDKDAYEAKARYAARSFNGNAEIATANGMTDEQVGFVAEVCAMRHWFHSNGADALCNEQSTAHDKAAGIAAGDWLDAEDRREALEGLGCGELYSPVPVEEMPMHCDWELVLDEDDREKFREDGEDEHDAYVNFTCHCHAENSKTVERINGEIEAWLRRVDAKFGTSFCPTGKSRELI